MSPGVKSPASQPSSRPAEPRQVGGEPAGIVQVANLIYAGTKSSKCFSDHFLVRAEKDSAISTSRRFHAASEIYAINASRARSDFEAPRALHLPP